MILSIGIGVDCNVIAAERIIDEFKNGKTIDGAIAAGFNNSLSAIIDDNVTVVIVMIYNFFNSSFNGNKLVFTVWHISFPYQLM